MYISTYNSCIEQCLPDMFFFNLQIICAKLPHYQLIHFLDSLLDGLLDSEPCSSSGASVVLNVLLKSSGRELYHQVNDILCKKIFIGGNINLAVYVIIHLCLLAKPFMLFKCLSSLNLSFFWAMSSNKSVVTHLQWMSATTMP